MRSYTEYYRRKLLEQKFLYSKVFELSILGKRKYRDAFGYDNDYEVVQQPSVTNLHSVYNSNVNWKDAYTENLFNK
jgi:hypothetical protein